MNTHEDCLLIFKQKISFELWKHKDGDYFLWYNTSEWEKVNRGKIVSVDVCQLEQKVNEEPLYKITSISTDYSFCMMRYNDSKSFLESLNLKKHDDFPYLNSNDLFKLRLFFDKVSYHAL